MNQTLTHFGTLDWVILGIVFVSVIVSFFRGFLREAISLATWFFAFFAAIKFSPILDNLLSSLISHHTTRFIVSTVSIFVVVLIIGMLINKLANSIVKTAGLGFFDKILGIIFGAARGLLFVIIILLVVIESPYQESSWFKQSQLAPHFKQPVSYFIDLLPKNIRSVSSWIEHFNSVRNKYHHPLAN